jgi:hypothetical protein
MKTPAVLCSLAIVFLSPALAQPPPPNDIIVCPKFYWGEWGGIHYYTASTCSTDMATMQCVEGEEIDAQSFRLHTTQPSCCCGETHCCADPIVSAPPPIGEERVAALAKNGKKYKHRMTRVKDGMKLTKLMRVVKDNEGKDKDDYMKLRGSAQPGETQGDPNRDYSFNRTSQAIQWPAALDAVLRVETKNGTTRYFRVLHLQATFPGETKARSLRIGQEVTEKDVEDANVTTIKAVFAEGSPDKEEYAFLKVDSLGGIEFEVEAHAKLEKP